MLVSMIMVLSILAGPRAAASRFLRRGKRQQVLADADDIAVLEPVGAHHLLVHEGAILALEVHQDKFVANRIQLGMMPGYGQVVDDDVVFLAAADGQGLALFGPEPADDVSLYLSVTEPYASASMMVRKGQAKAFFSGARAIRSSSKTACGAPEA